MLDAFVEDGRITSLPAARTKRRVLLDWLAQDFEPGRRYPEARVNEILEHHDVDSATLRRYLVDEDLLDRAWGLTPTSRLSCQAIVSNEDVTIEIPKYTINHARENH